MRISAVIMAKNEEKVIDDCLKSIDWVNEIILVDDFSTDKTAAIARAKNARIYTRKLDTYANQKNFGISKARNSWILIIDADERISPELMREIQKIKLSKYVSYSIPFKNYLGNKWLAHGGLYPDRHTRIFNRKFAQYSPGNVHELLNIKGRTGKLHNPIVHYTYNNTFDYYNKVKEYSKLEAKDRKEVPTLTMVYKTFYRKYIKLQGYKDGWAGLISAKLLAYYEYLIRKEMRRKR